MECKIKNDIGTIYITEDVMLKVVGYAALECYGIVAMSSKRAKDGLVQWLGRENLSKGVRVELGEEDNVKVEISFLALFGHNICEVAKEVQENVRRQIESMTGLHVTEVNVHVGGVTFAPAEKPAEPEEKTEPVSEAEEPAAEQPQDTPAEPETATE